MTKKDASPQNTKTLSSSSDFQAELRSIGETVKSAKDAIDIGLFTRVVSSPIDGEKLPLPMKIFGALLIIASAYSAFDMVFNTFNLVQMVQGSAIATYGVSTVVVECIYMATSLLLALMLLAFGVSIFRNRRRFAAILIYGIHILLIASIVCSLMLYGVAPDLIGWGIAYVILVLFQIYLDPGLRQERKLQHILRDQEVKQEKEEGSLGRDASGKGYIDLNFFNLFWIFVIAALIGDGIETLYHYFVVVPGEWQIRAGVLWGPFSPIYGIGAVLMTLFLNRLYKRNLVVVFLLGALIGGAFEFAVSYFMQYAFGVSAWDYTGAWLSIGGRTCGAAMCAWGALGVVWIKLILPLLLQVVNLIPWNWRYTITNVAAVLMFTDCVMTLQALDCWYSRLASGGVDTNLQEFYAQYFNDTFMQNRFQSMSIDPSTAIRNN